MKSEWRVEASLTERWDDNVHVLFSMIPRDALARSSLGEVLFWRDVESRVRSRAHMAGLGEAAVQTYLRRAKSNRGLCIALVVCYD